MKRLGMAITLFACFLGAINSMVAMFASRGVAIYCFGLSGLAFIAAFGSVVKDLEKDKENK